MAPFLSILFRNRVLEVRRRNMTVLDAGSGSGRRKKKAESKRFLSVFQFKMRAIREVLKRRNQISRLAEKRMRKRKEVKDEEVMREWKEKKMLDKEIAKKKKEIEDLVKRARERKGDSPVVKLRIQVSYPGKRDRGREKSFLMQEKHVTRENLEKMGLPGEIENSVKSIQEKLESVRNEHKRMINEANALIKTIQRMEI